MNKAICVIGATLGAVVGVPLAFALMAIVYIGVAFGLGWVELQLLPLEQFTTDPFKCGNASLLGLAVGFILYVVGDGFYRKCRDYWEDRDLRAWEKQNEDSSANTS
jgi:hypothetical protein